MEKLKILLVLQTPWGTGLGMSKVHYDLKKNMKNQGMKLNTWTGTSFIQKGKMRMIKFSGLYIRNEFYIT